jgi:cobalt/nickel transport system ATP-binding protein
MKEPLIRLKGITFRYDKKYILHGVDLEVFEDEKIGLWGPNGAGKTTLLYIIMGFLKPESGIVEIFGKRRDKEEDFLEVRQKVGFLFQDSDSQLFCPTVKEDIAFGPLNLGKSREETIKIVEETCALLGLIELKDRLTHKLSYGEKRLTALATVIAMNPLCYLLDEPCLGLDETTQKRILSILRDNAKTYLVVSHDREFLRQTTDKVFILKDGKLFQTKPDLL